MVLADDLLHGRGMDGRLRWRGERRAVVAYFDDGLVAGLGGYFEAAEEIPIGTACHLALDGERELLIVVVGAGNRFLVCSDLDH